MDTGLQHKTALVTAGSKGIGKAAARLLAAEGASVAVCSSSRANVDACVTELASSGAKVVGFTCDLNSNDDIRNAYQAAMAALGRIDILINNCGGPRPGFFGELGEEAWDHAYSQVLMSAVRFTKLVIPQMKERLWGRVITITSVSVKQPIENLILSNTFRTGLLGFNKTLSTQLAPYGITVNSVAPGYTLTERIYEIARKRAETEQKTPDEILQLLSAEIPMKRFASPEEIAAAVLFLASQQAGYITGNTMVVDGGLVKGIL